MGKGYVKLTFDNREALRFAIEQIDILAATKKYKHTSYAESYRNPDHKLHEYIETDYRNSGKRKLLYSCIVHKTFFQNLQLPDTNNQPNPTPGTSTHKNP